MTFVHCPDDFLLSSVIIDHFGSSNKLIHDGNLIVYGPLIVVNSVLN